MRLINKKWSTKRNKNKTLQTAFKNTFSSFWRECTICSCNWPIRYLLTAGTRYFIVRSSLVLWSVGVHSKIARFHSSLKQRTGKLSHLTWNWACLAPKNVAEFKCTNQNVRTFYFRHKSVNQVFGFLTSVTPWWWQTCYEIKHLENDIKTLNICECSTALLPILSLVYFLEFTKGFRRFLGPRPRKDDRARIIQNGRLPWSKTPTTKVGKPKCFFYSSPLIWCEGPLCCILENKNLYQILD